jgi:hypothetical protein
MPSEVELVKWARAGADRNRSHFGSLHKLALTARTHIAGGASTGVMVPRSRPVGECRRAFFLAFHFE